MTANPECPDEPYWHFTGLSIPQLAGEDAPGLLSVYLEPMLLGLTGLWQAGSGVNVGSYGFDDFLLTGRAAIAFADESQWERFEAGTPFDFALEFSAATGFMLKIECFSCVSRENSAVNKVGTLTYDFGWQSKAADPAASCRFTIVNDTPEY
jgi:hypothetical protein